MTRTKTVWTVPRIAGLTIGVAMGALILSQNAEAAEKSPDNLTANELKDTLFGGWSTEKDCSGTAYLFVDERIVLRFSTKKGEGANARNFSWEDDVILGYEYRKQDGTFVFASLDQSVDKAKEAKKGDDDAKDKPKAKNEKGKQQAISVMTGRLESPDGNRLSITNAQAVEILHEDDKNSNKIDVKIQPPEMNFFLYRCDASDLRTMVKAIFNRVNQ